LEKYIYVSPIYKIQILEIIHLNIT